jgi:hypothetical protein
MNLPSSTGGVLHVACGNRREAVCPGCSQVYKRDARQLVPGRCIAARQQGQFKQRAARLPVRPGRRLTELSEAGKAEPRSAMPCGRISACGRVPRSRSRQGAGGPCRGGGTPGGQPPGYVRVATCSNIFYTLCSDSSEWYGYHSYSTHSERMNAQCVTHGPDGARRLLLRHPGADEPRFPGPARRARANR